MSLSLFLLIFATFSLIVCNKQCFIIKYNQSQEVLASSTNLLLIKSLVDGDLLNYFYVKPGIPCVRMIRSGLNLTKNSLTTLCNIHRNSFTKHTVYKSFSSKIKKLLYLEVGQFTKYCCPKNVFPLPAVNENGCWT